MVPQAAHLTFDQVFEMINADGYLFNVSPADALGPYAGNGWLTTSRIVRMVLSAIAAVTIRGAYGALFVTEVNATQIRLYLGRRLQDRRIAHFRSSPT